MELKGIQERIDVAEAKLKKVRINIESTEVYFNQLKKEEEAIVYYLYKMKSELGDTYEKLSISVTEN